jgi:phospholipase/carboxylesterase
MPLFNFLKPNRETAMPNPLLPAVEIAPKGPQLATIFWLHGLGADGYDFEPIARELDLPPSLGVKFVLPHAPRRPITINGGYIMRAWYDIAVQDLSLKPDEAGITESVWALADWLESEIAHGIAPERIILAGFSQGGVIALETAAQHQDQTGGVIALSTYVARPEAFPTAARPLPVFMGHGAQDPMVPYALGERSRRLLEAKGYDVEWRRYAMPHSVCRDEVADIRNWLLRRLGAG